MKLEPIAPGVWTDGPAPQLLAGLSANGDITFPIPAGDSGNAMEVTKLSRTGTLWSFTRQDFQPKPPYEGPEKFVPFLVGYIELPEQTIVEAHIVETTLEELELGMAMELVIVPFDESRSNFAFRPQKN